MNSQPSDRMALGSSDLRVSPLGVGTNSWGVNRKADPGLQSTFDAALNRGVNFFDTAEVYGFGGSERTLGLFLQTTSQPLITATKFAPLPWRVRKTSLIAALQASLARLHLTRADLYLIHFPLTPVSVETWMDALADAVEAGLTRAVGVSNYNADQMQRAHAALARRGIALACNQVEYSLLRRKVERNGLLALCKELGVTLVAYRPLCSGLLSGKYTPDSPPSGLRRRMYDHAYLLRIAPLIDRLREIGQRQGKTPSQVALNWVMCQGALPIPGAKNAQQAADNAGALGWRLEADDLAALDRACKETSG
jgi:aryl-alcohol dehydrogenase-like predicted oxidoreductase